MEPNTGNKRLEDVVASAPSELERPLPLPSPRQSPPTRTYEQKVRRRLLIPATVLVLVLPVATWHLRGDQTRYPNELYLHYILKLPAWLIELPYPMGLVSVATVLAALCWLVVEYWLRSWRRWWSVVLGILCVLGMGAALGGREATLGTTGVNLIGGIFVMGSPGALMASLILLGHVCFKIVESPVFPRSWSIHLDRKKVAVNLWKTLAGLVVISGIGVTIYSGFVEQELSIAQSALVGLSIVPIFAFHSTIVILLYSFLLLPILAGWFLLFHPADLVQRRRTRW